ncbi:MAG: D-alanyl-D-alanine carboxypeptidase [Firmicutes bacterium]|nr:D-alanyl-D-alanine carboxypeptidase [Dethiobacter sp.]MBS3897414.1 D-alanyl-D-alanine carboxypeptidase [Dethiobacter sp.]MCL5992655.1 D-alanyl-D-alanine carboxypeptidase [Bacillota bacterium]
MPAKKRIFAAVLLCVFLFSASVHANPEIQAPAAILINSRTGEVLWEKNAHEIKYPASTTKILTTLLLLENAVEDEIALTSRLATTAEGASLSLAEGQEIRVEDLLYGLMHQSANDGSVVAAEHVGGSVETFAAIMNLRAKQMGARNSYFTNPHGLPDEEHVTTAYDLAMIARSAMMNPRFREIAAAKRHSIPWPDGIPRIIVNRIPLMRSYEGMLGIKSGYTVAAQQTFVGAAERDGLELIAVVLQANGAQLWADTVALLDYGFENFTAIFPVIAGEVLATVPVRFGETVSLQAANSFEITRPQETVDVALELKVEDGRPAPIQKGDILGEAVILVAGEQVGSVPLIAANDVTRAAPTTGRFWLLLLLAVLGGLRIRKLYRRRNGRKKLRLKNGDSVFWSENYKSRKLRRMR